MWRNPQEEAEQMSSSRISHEINQPASLGYPPIQCKVTNHPSLPGSAMMIWINGPILRLSGHLPGMPRGTTYSECCSATALFCGARIRNMPEEEVIQHNWRICHALCCQYNGIEWIESKWMCMFFPVVLCAMQLVKYGQVLKGAWLPKWMVGWRGVPTFVEAHDSICGSFGFMKVSHDLTAHQKKFP